jgi:hypothetical protein
MTSVSGRDAKRDPFPACLPHISSQAGSRIYSNVFQQPAADRRGAAGEFLCPRAGHAAERPGYGCAHITRTPCRRRARVDHRVAGSRPQPQAFDRLYKAFQEFLQALFIAHRTYPLVYNKWIREQVTVWLDLPELYVELPRILEVSQLEGDGICQNASHLLALLEQWVPEAEERSSHEQQIS